MSPCLLHKVIDPQRQVHVHEIDFFGIVENLEEARCNEVSVKRETGVFPQEIIVAAEKKLNAN